MKINYNITDYKIDINAIVDILYGHKAYNVY